MALSLLSSYVDDSEKSDESSSSSSSCTISSSFSSNPSSFSSSSSSPLHLLPLPLLSRRLISHVLLKELAPQFSRMLMTMESSIHKHKKSKRSHAEIEEDDKSSAAWASTASSSAAQRSKLSLPDPSLMLSSSATHAPSFLRDVLVQDKMKELEKSQTAAVPALISGSAKFYHHPHKPGLLQETAANTASSSASSALDLISSANAISELTCSEEVKNASKQYAAIAAEAEKQETELLQKQRAREEAGARAPGPERSGGAARTGRKSVYGPTREDSALLPHLHQSNRLTVKDREKTRRMRGQSGISDTPHPGWKSELEMKMRQNFDS